MTYVYVCNAMGCEDVQNKFCGYDYACPFCGEGRMRLDEERSEPEDFDEDPR
jgi:hypothetical protein